MASISSSQLVAKFDWEHFSVKDMKYLLMTLANSELY